MEARRDQEPVEGVDYPGTWREFVSWFGDDTACLRYLERLRWPDGFVCPRCRSERGWRVATGHWKCMACGVKTSVTAGTIFDKTRTPLATWFAAAWYATSQKNGVSALGLQRVLGLGSYETAWVWLHKLRRAMVRPGRDRLQGEVEVDETYVGGTEEGAIGRHTSDKAIVVIAAERRGRRVGRIRMRRIPDVTAATLTAFVQEAVEPGSAVLTDAWSGCRHLSAAGYSHEAVSLRARGEPALVVMPNVHLVAGLLKRWIVGTHQGAPAARHLDYYLDEFTFRFNRRRSRRRGLLSYRLLQQAVNTPPAPLKQLVGRRDNI